MMNITDVLPPPPEGGNYDGALVKRTFGTDLPPDYVDFVQTYGHGAIDDWLFVLTPGWESRDGDICREVEYTKMVIDAHREAGLPTPYQAYPDPGGLIGWGNTANGDVCCWKTGDADPSKWPVVVADSERVTWDRFEGTMTEFLVAVLTGRHRCPVFPKDFPSDSPRFVSSQRGGS